ncbi:helix-turn-helix domain-containing protein, partial [Anaerotruncus colihominis]
MYKRIKELRKALHFTQQEFADRIGIKRNTIANYETGRNDPIDAVISLICKEFNVNER